MGGSIERAVSLSNRESRWREEKRPARRQAGSFSSGGANPRETRTDEGARYPHGEVPRERSEPRDDDWF
jgi:hypothetical protein